MSWKWVKEFHFFLFDFDGLLVDTEPLHFAAYQKLCQQHGCTLDWSYEKYCQAAHFSSTALRDQMYRDFPQFKEIPWEVFYHDKKKQYNEVIKDTAIPMMPGAKELLDILKNNDILHCVVTNSIRSHIDEIREKQPALQSIPFWFTREDYQHPKPHPDGYLKAMRTLGNKNMKVIGFEDSIRGLTALQATPALPILITHKSHPLVKYADHSRPFLHFESLTEMEALQSLSLS